MSIYLDIEARLTCACGLLDDRRRQCDEVQYMMDPTATHYCIAILLLCLEGKT